MGARTNPGLTGDVAVISKRSNVQQRRGKKNSATRHATMCSGERMRDLRHSTFRRRRGKIDADRYADRYGILSVSISKCRRRFVKSTWPSTMLVATGRGARSFRPGTSVPHVLSPSPPFSSSLPRHAHFILGQEKLHFPQQKPKTKPSTQTKNGNTSSPDPLPQIVRARHTRDRPSIWHLSLFPLS